MSGDAKTPLFAAARWRELRVLIDRLEALSADARERALAAVAERDAELAAAARDLLAEPSAAAAQPEHAVERLLDGIDTAIPERIGPFQPVRRIGSRVTLSVSRDEHRNAACCDGGTWWTKRMLSVHGKSCGYCAPPIRNERSGRRSAASMNSACSAAWRSAA